MIVKNQKVIKRIVATMITASMLAMPISVCAHPTTTPIVTPNIDAATAEREAIRNEREMTRSEGEKSGEKLTVDPAETSVAALFANGNLTEDQIANIIGEICKKDYQKSGILASVSAAQCILESGFLSTSLAMEANNCFGMKATLSGNTWPGTSWEGAIFTKQTWEEYGGSIVNIMADFRSYPTIEKSLADHSAYLLGAQNGAYLRYGGLQGEKDYKTAIQIIKNGGYATDSKYVEKVCSIIERFNLTQYDVIEAPAKPLELYRVRKTWEDVGGQLGAYVNLENAKAKCTSGYKVFNPQGEVVFEVK